MNTRTVNRINKIKERIAFNILGAYAKGAGEDVAFISGCKYNQLGELISASGEAFNPLDTHIDLDKFNSAPDRLSFIKDLVDYSTDKISDYVLSLDVSGYKEDALYEAVKEYAKDINRNVTKLAYSEGTLDDELKEDISLILKEGKERFEQRVREKEKQAPAETTEAEIPSEVMPEDGEDNNDTGDIDSNVGEPEDMGAEFMSDDISFDDENEEEPTDDEEETGETSMEEAAAAMNESYVSLKYIKEIAKGESSSVVNKYLEKYNLNKPYAEGMKYLHKGKITSLDTDTINSMVNKIMEAEENLFKGNVKASGEGVRHVLSDNYQMNTKTALHSLAVALVVREKLKL